MTDTNLYAVYGSLRKGWWNHDWALRDAQQVSTTRVPGYKLMSNGCFPAAIEAPDALSVVEVYDVSSVDADIIDSMDGMEFNCGYIRRLVTTEDGNVAWLYVMPEDRAYRFDEDVPGNDWALTSEGGL